MTSAQLTMQSSCFTGKRILITGASGFIGSRLRERLRQYNAEVHAISRSKQPVLKDAIQWWQVDITDLETLTPLFSRVRPDYIFNLASYVNGSRDISVVLPSLKNNLMGQINLMLLAREVGCKRFVSAGSMEEPTKDCIRGTVSSPYAAAKWSASIYGKMFHELYDLPFVSLRIFMVYGPGQKDVSKLVPYSILSLLRGKAPELTSGKRRIDWIYVEDVVEGILAAASTPKIEGAKLDIGSGVSLSISAVEDILAGLINPKIKPNFGAVKDRPFEQEPVANVAETYARINWKPMVSLASGLEKTVKWYSDNMHSFDNVPMH